MNPVGFARAVSAVGRGLWEYKPEVDKLEALRRALEAVYVDPKATPVSVDMKWLVDNDGWTVGPRNSSERYRLIGFE